MKVKYPRLQSIIGGAVLILASGMAVADAGHKSVSITLNAGETYVIKGLGEDSTPAVHVIDNPNALVVRSDAPGQLVLVGAGAGEWALDVTNAEGEKLTYTVDVKSIRNPADSRLTPGKAPAALGSDLSSAAAPAPIKTAALDPGSGPVDSPPLATASDSSASTGAGKGSSERAAVKSETAPLSPTSPPADKVASERNADKSEAVPSPSTPAPSGSTSGSAPAPGSATEPSKVASLSDSTSSAVTHSDGASAAITPSTTAAATAAPATLSASPAAAADPGAPINPGSSSAALKLAAYIPPSAATSASSNSAANVPTLPSQSASTLPLPKRYSSDLPAIPQSPSESGPGGTNFLPDDVVIVASGASRIFDFTHRIRRISLADTEVADIQVINPYQINLIGHKEGFTTLAIWDTQGHYEERQVRVDPFGRQQVMLNVIVAELNRGRLEQNGFNWSTALRKANFTIFNNLGGGPATPVSASSNIKVSGPQGSSSGAFMPFGGELLPLMLSNNVTYGISAGSGDSYNQAFFEYLEAHNLGKVLSEPRLLANSGEKAEFLDGGEIPIVITQALNSDIVFKQFGTSVIFVPTVVGKDEIELLVKPEVSQPDFGNGVNLFGFTIPAFVTRRAQTVVRLRNNQTLIIAGLILRTPTSSVNKVPYLGDLPWIGNAFKNTNYNNQESDLMMSVTPQIVEPLPNSAQLATPTSSVGPMNADDIRTQRLPVYDVSRPRF